MKNKLFFTLILLWVLASNTKAQNASLEWVSSAGGSDYDYANSIATDASGNVYTTGFFKGIVDFDPGTGVLNLGVNISIRDIFIQKLDPFGNLLWAKSIGYWSSFDEAYSITVDASGNVYITGSISGIVDFDPGIGIFNLNCAGCTGIFILKLDAAGNFIWAKSMSGVGTARGMSITTDSYCNVYLTGYYTGVCNFDTLSNLADTCNGGYDIFIQKFDSSGNTIWAKFIGGSGFEKSYSIAVDVGCNIYLTGKFEDWVDFNPGTGFNAVGSNGSADCFILKLDASGDFVWVNTMSGYKGSAGKSVALDTDANVYITGYFSGTALIDSCNYNKIISSNGFEDIFIEKFDSAGNFIWVKTMGGISHDVGNSISIDAIGRLYVTGSFQGLVDFDPGSSITSINSNNASKDIFIQKLDASGNFIWVESMGGSDTEEKLSMSIDSAYNICISGIFNGTADFEPGNGVTSHTSNGYCDIFTAKLSQCITTSSFTLSKCNSYTWPINNTTYTSSGTYTATLTNASGCDSIITLNLTINTVNDSVTKNGTTLTTNEAGASYQWLDCNNGYAIITGATNQSFTPIVNGNYAVEITKNGCIDTSICYSITNIGIIENSFGDEFVFYPNPTSGIVNLEFGSNYKNVYITIRNSEGKLVKQQQYTNKQNISLELEGNIGVYLVEVISGHNRAVIMVLKQ